MRLFAERAHDKVSDVKFAAFLADENLHLAVTFLIMQIGENGNHLSEVLVEANPTLPLTETRGLRNRIAHESLSVDYGIIYSIASDELPRLIQQIETLLRDAIK